MTLIDMAVLARLRGEQAASVVLFMDALVVSAEVEDALVLPRALGGLAGAAALEENYTKAARLIGAAEVMQEGTGTCELSTRRAVSDSDTANVQAALGSDSYAALWAEGRAMSVDKAVTYALGLRSPR
jgi:hypothetical protein